jgi:ABC-type transport system involved in cytochrome c biogenesis permease subunit
MISSMSDHGWLNLLALAFYLAAEGFSIAHMRKDEPVLGRVTTWLLALGFLIHFAALELGGRATHTVPYHDLTSSMSLFAWMVVGAYGVLRVVHRESATGPFLIPIAILFMGVSLMAHSGHALVSDPKFMGALFAFHVTIAIFGYAALTLSFVLAQLYLIQTRQLHRRTMGILFSRLPALDVLWRLHTTAVVHGVVALFIASTLGIVWAKKNWGTYWDAKVAFTFLMIGVYLFTLFSPRLGLGAKKTAWLSIGGFLLLMFSYTVVNLFITSEHVFR